MGGAVWPDLLTRTGVGGVVFAATNVDGFLLLCALFASPRLKGRAIVAGQALGMAVLIGVSVLAALASVTVPARWTALLGLIPMALGIWALVVLIRGGLPASGDVERVWTEEQGLERRTGSQILAVAGLTLASGGDNLAAYIPLFAAQPRAIPLYVAVFVAMTVLWCWLSHRLARGGWAGGRVRRWGPVVLPFVLMALGARILWGAFAG
jgi:cadmium resistance protein CadD (predicted permease)